MNRKLKCKLDPGAVLPTRGTPKSAGLDLYATEDQWLFPLIPTRIKTGVSMAIPEDRVGLVWPRSGLGSRGFNVLGGVIDEDYRGFIGVLVVLLRLWPMRIRKGDRVAQLLIAKIEYVDPAEVHSLDDTDRGAGSYGSTGR